MCDTQRAQMFRMGRFVTFLKKNQASMEVKWPVSNLFFRIQKVSLSIQFDTKDSRKETSIKVSILHL